MNKITLFSATSTNMTIINNRFIDYYMPSANGSFVKIYLYLLRCFQESGKDISLPILAEKLDETEKDIDRGIRYWEKEQLLNITRGINHEIESITFVFPSEENSKEEVTVPVTDLPAKEQAVALDTLAKSSGKEHAKAIHRPNYSEAQIKGLTDMEEVKWIMNTVERLLERLLKPMDIQLILFLYESVGFPAELIFYLYEYCVSKNKKNASYIETVAISWAEEGIDTVEKAESATLAYNNNYNAVNKAFGLNRAPGTIEKKYMHRWFHVLCFDIPIIEEACNRTILATGKPDFKYADKILENWHKKGVNNLSDLTVLDEEHIKQVNTAATNKQMASKQGSGTNRFNAFPQRTYSTEDIESMEQRLLNSR